MVKTNGRIIRRTVFWIVFIGGCLSLAGLIFYYSGYRIDWQTRQIIQLGSLSVTVTPKGSQVFLDGQLLNKTTPAIFNSIKPGEYNLRIEHSGNSTLEFQISVRSKSTTVINNLFLPAISNAHPGIPPDQDTALSAKQLSDLSLVKDWPIWSMSGQDPTGIITGNNRQLSVIQEGKVIPLKEWVTQLDTNNELSQLTFIESGTAWMVYTNFNPMLEFILTRQSNPFVDIQLVPHMQAVVLADEHTIQLIEIGPQQTVSTTKIASGEHLKRIQIDTNGQLLYFIDDSTWYVQNLQSQ